MLTTALPHQLTALAAASDAQGAARHNFCFFMEQGTGKTWTALAEFESLHRAQLVDAMAIVAPNGVHRAWIEIEIPKHFGLAKTFLWSPNATKKRETAFTAFISRPPGNIMSLSAHIAAFNCEAFSHTQSDAEWHLKEILRRFRTYLVFDESQTLKTPSAKRSKNLARLGKAAVYRRLATGTHIAESPLDVYAQFRALDKSLLGFHDFATFKSHFAEWHTRENATGQKWEAITRWQHLDELRRLIDAHAFVITKAECLNLPPKTHLVRYVDLPPAARRLYNAARERAIVELAEATLTGTLTMRFAFTRLLRLAQITGGFIQPDGASAPTLIHSAKLEAVSAIIDELPPTAKAIIWCRFRHEANDVAAMLNATGPLLATLVHGGIPPSTRAERVMTFSSDPAIRFMVGTTATGGRGWNLTAATHMIYYSNNFSLEQRLQSEDRIHRYGQTVPVTYYDLVVPNTVDELTLKMVTEKRTIADLFKGDPRALRTWLERQA